MKSARRRIATGPVWRAQCARAKRKKGRLRGVQDAEPASVRSTFTSSPKGVYNALTACVSHRDPASHSCAPTTPTAPPKNEAARQLLAKNFPSSVAKSTPRVKKSANKQIAIMQMRRRAQPADIKDDRPSVNVPISDRLHIEVEVEDGLSGGVRADCPKVFWLRKVRAQSSDSLNRSHSPISSRMRRASALAEHWMH